VEEKVEAVQKKEGTQAEKKRSKEIRVFKKRLERDFDEVSQAKRNGSEWESGWSSNSLVPSKSRWMRTQV
jgi:hypothetical protein